VEAGFAGIRKYWKCETVNPGWKGENRVWPAQLEAVEPLRPGKQVEGWDLLCWMIGGLGKSMRLLALAVYSGSDLPALFCWCW
jgi:hypothetical protein